MRRRRRCGAARARKQRVAAGVAPETGRGGERGGDEREALVRRANADANLVGKRKLERRAARQRARRLRRRAAPPSARRTTPSTARPAHQHALHVGERRAAPHRHANHGPSRAAGSLVLLLPLLWHAAAAADSYLPVGRRAPPTATAAAAAAATPMKPIERPSTNTPFRQPICAVAPPLVAARRRARTHAP